MGLFQHLMGIMTEGSEGWGINAYPTVSGGRGERESKEEFLLSDFLKLGRKSLSCVKNFHWSHAWLD